MKYFGNYMDDVVIREDDNGNRYKKYDYIKGEIGPCNLQDKEAFGGESYGLLHVLDPISEEEYLSYGVTWKYGDNGDKMTIL